jgi:hypothetical protein
MKLKPDLERFVPGVKKLLEEHVEKANAMKPVLMPSLVVGALEQLPTLEALESHGWVWRITV